MYRKSKYLKIYNVDENYFVYHELFGNLSKLNRNAYKLLESFDEKNNKLTSDIKSEVLNSIIDNYFLVEDDEETLIINEELENRKNANDGRLLVGLQLILSNFCNFSCKYCFLNEEHKLRENSVKNAPSNMNIDVAEKAVRALINNIKANDNDVLSIEFFGGEPLINWKVIKQILDLYKSGEDFGIEIYYTITTNGSLITDEMIEYFEKYNVSVIISYDSPKSKERINKNGKQVSEIIIPILEKMRNYNVTTSFNSVISKWTIKNYDYQGLVDFAIKYGISNIALILDLDAEITDEGYNDNDIVELILKTYDYGIKKGLTVTGYWEKMYSQIRNEDPTFYEKGYKACPATGCKISVEPSGDIFSCKCCTYKIGQLDNLNEILNGKRYREYLNKVYKNGEECFNCEIKGFCSGLCVGALEKKGSMYGINKKLCNVYKRVTKELIVRTKDREFTSIIEL